jgi:uncharacterized membrane protein
MRWSDERAEQVIGNLLRVGVIAAAAIMLIGGALYLARHGAEPAGQHLFRGEPVDLTTPRGILADTLARESRGIIQLGVLATIAVPVLRVLFSIISFALEHDWGYVAVTVIVFLILCASLFSGH